MNSKWLGVYPQWVQNKALLGVEGANSLETSLYSLNKMYTFLSVWTYLYNIFIFEGIKGTVRVSLSDNFEPAPEMKKKRR
jgi:hypothetical protein